MNLKNARIPFFRYTDTVGNLMQNMMIMFAALLVIPVLYYGLRPVVTLGICVLTCMVCEIIFCLFSRKEIHISDGAFMVTGSIIALLLPINVSWYIPLIASAFAVFVAKMPFGGTGNSPFNPAAAGIAFVTLSFPKEVFNYFDISVGGKLSAWSGYLSVPTAGSPAAILKNGGRPLNTLWDMLTGNVIGPVGCTATLVVITCGIFLLLCNMIHREVTAGYILFGAITAAVFHRLPGIMDSVQYEIFSGSFLFCGIFLMNEPGTTPRQPLGRFIYGCLGGIFTMLYRFYGAYEQGGVFAVLLVNALAPAIDRRIWRLLQGNHTSKQIRLFHRRESRQISYLYRRIRRFYFKKR